MNQLNTPSNQANLGENSSPCLPAILAHEHGARDKEVWKLAATAAGNDEIHSIHVPLFSLPRESLEEEDDDGEEEEEEKKRARRDPVRTVQAQALARSLGRTKRQNTVGCWGKWCCTDSFLYFVLTLTQPGLCVCST